MVLMSLPFSSKWVAKLCLRVCTVIRFGMPPPIPTPPLPSRGILFLRQRVFAVPLLLLGAEPHGIFPRNQAFHPFDEGRFFVNGLGIFADGGLIIIWKKGDVRDFMVYLQLHHFAIITIA